jgi:predicted acylesterase/phospholipase RssA
MATNAIAPEAAAPSQRWWLDREARINGIFKGGGAKGLMYAGAVQAVEQRGEWFRAVSGASAGAITATLIAAGLTVEELGSAVPEAMKRVHKMWLGDLVGSPIIRVGKLQKWLEEQLRGQVTKLAPEIPIEEGREVTFRQLHEATGIELYVVAVDVVLRQPMVFSASTTPDVPISPAVMASSAIPLAFRPGRLQRLYPNGKTEVHRLMDGGVWANYPAFVFKDASFREHHGLPALPADSITIGFTLDSGVAMDAGTPVGFAGGSAPLSQDQGGALKGMLRFGFLRVYLMTIVPIVIALQTLYTLNHGGLTFLKDYATRDGVPLLVTNVAAFFDGFFTSFTPALWAVIAVMLAGAMGLAVIGATLIDSGIPAIRTLMAVGTDVPYWVGTTERDHVIRLLVPPGLQTTSFRLKPAAVEEAVASAREQADEQLAVVLPPGGGPP